MRERDSPLKTRHRLLVVTEPTLRHPDIRDRAGFAAPMPRFPVELERFLMLLDGSL